MQVDDGQMKEALEIDGQDSKQRKSVDDEDDDDFGFDPEKYVPFAEKEEFADLMKRTTKEGLTQVVNYLLEKQPEAIDDFGNDRLQIKIDCIERECFEHCREILEQNIKEGMPSKRQKTK